MIRRKVLVALVSAGALAITAASCSEKKEGDDSEESSESGTDDPGAEAGTLAISDNPLAESYPEGLTVAGLPEVVDQTPGALPSNLQVGLELTQDDPQNPDPNKPPMNPDPNNPPMNPDPNNPGPNNPGPGGPGGPDQGGDIVDGSKHPKERIADQHKVLSGEGECFAPGAINSLTHQSTMQDICFQFDIGMTAGKQQGVLEKGQFNPTVQSFNGQTAAELLEHLKSGNGFQSNPGDEACMVVKGREKILQRSHTFEAALALFRGMLCQAKKDEVADAIAVGDKLDLKDVLAKGSDDPNVTINTADVERLADKDGRAVYKTSIDLKTGQQGLHGTGEVGLVLYHSPSASGNTEYNGVLQFYTGRVDDQTNEEFLNIVSLIYDRSGTTAEDARVRFEIRDASYNVERLNRDEFFKADGRVNMNVGNNGDGSFGPGEANDYSEGMGYFAFDINPYSYAGKISFWLNPGGSYQEMARGFVFSVDQKEDGTLAGCSWAGAMNSSIRAAIKEGGSFVPTGCSTPQFKGVCSGSQSWKQCFAQDADGVYQLDLDKIEDDTAGFDVLQTAPTDVPEIDLSDLKTISIE